MPRTIEVEHDGAVVAHIVTEVWITLQFEAFHRWAKAPADVSFLRFWHRHMFGLRAGVYVGHADRDVEFFQLKRKVWGYIQERWEGQQFENSCEDIAKAVVGFLISEGYEVSQVTVDEDGENGATVTVLREDA